MLLFDKLGSRFADKWFAIGYSSYRSTGQLLAGKQRVSNWSVVPLAQE